MKKILLVLLVVVKGFSLNAQSTTGLIAHWDMNGEVNDVTGNGHNGTATDLTADTGMSGLPNTAYYFNGSTSIMTAPYLPDLNLTHYSICATVKVKGFYTAFCQVNTIFTRGGLNMNGSYTLFFYDNPFDGNSCSLFDTTKDVFLTNLSTYYVPNYLYQYTPTIVEDKWYRVIGTWDGTHFNIYVNDTLKTSNLPTSGSNSSTTDSLSIGQSVYNAALGGPYNFKGLIDDVRLYNRVLSDSEISHYGDTCGTITRQPVSDTIYAGRNAIYTVRTSIASAIYQWQEDAGTGFVNLTNSGPYSGVYTDSFTITGATTAMAGYHFRCIVSNLWGCGDTTSSALLRPTLGTNDLLLNNNVSLYPNPAGNAVFIEVPYDGTSGKLRLLNELGQVVAENTFTSKTTRLDIAALAPGMYILKVDLDGQVIYRKVTKK